MAHNPPVDVQAFGQSIWYDNISRALINNGEVQRLVDEDGVMGITSNPALFQKAIAQSDDYDETIAQLLDADANAIFEALAIKDIQDGADILRPIYDQTNGGDGYISLEVSPLIANNTETTLNEGTDTEVSRVGEVGMICTPNFQLVDDNGSIIDRNDSGSVDGDATYVSGGRDTGILYDITEEQFRKKDYQSDVNRDQPGSGL